MTPDEVVLELKLSIEKDCACRACATIPFAITLLQDYQKLRERVSEEKIEEILLEKIEEILLNLYGDDTKGKAQAIITFLGCGENLP